MDVLILDWDGKKIKGESTLPDYKDMIEVLSFSHSVAQPMTGDHSNQKRTSGRPHHQNFTFTKYLDLASASLIDFCNQAKPGKKITFTVGQTESGKVNPYYKMIMHNVLISSISVGGGGGKPVETVTLDYSAVEWEYKQQNAAVGDAGKAAAAWDLAKNKASKP